MNTLYIDLETYNTVDLKTVGVFKYAETVEIMLFAYALNDGPVQVWDLFSHKDMPRDLKEYLSIKNLIICAHNSGFERTVLGPAYHGYTWSDTMIRALAHGLPGGLDILSTIYKLPVDKAKDKEGKKLIQLFCKPQRDGTRATPFTHRKQWEEFKEYNRLDVEAERELDKKLPRWNDTAAERALWRLDTQINDRGFLVDIDLAEKAIEAVDSEKKIKDAKTKELTQGDVNAATQRDALLKHILEIHGVELPNLQISTLNRRLEDPDLPEPVKELIRLRLQSSGTSTKKYTTLLKSVSSDNRLRGTLQFCGAPRTGRWAARRFQPHNLPRPKFKAAEIETGIEAIKAGSADLIYNSVQDIASSALRGVIIAPPGKKLVVSDLSSIEGRKLAWLAGEKWKLQAYRDYDAGIGYDMYVLTYSKTFNIQPEDVDKEMRQLGKVLELALGYGGGVGAFVTFANGYNIDLHIVADELLQVIPSYVINQAYDFWEYSVENKKTYGLTERVFVACDSVKRLWREANPAISRFWSDLENGVFEALVNGRTVKLQHLTIDKKGSWLRIQLPSGRYLCYAGAKYENRKIKYLGMNQYSRKWGYLYTYGGKLAENVTQASSRDVLAHGMLASEKRGYETVLSVHDELITEAPDTPEFTHTELSSLMATVPEWAPGLPLAAEGFESYRYRKD